MRLVLARRNALALFLLPLPACLPAAEMAPADGSTGPGQTDATGQPSTGADETTAGPPAVCGDGMVEGDEQCDDGPDNADTAACTTTCTAATCGDGLVHEGVEECDDGNEVDDDACTSACELPAVCGDGQVDKGEECDDGEANSSEGACMLDCTASVCGDGMVSSRVEQCDDGNDDNNDACTELCAPPTCGDGFAQTVNSELCDDGDRLEGDECNADCTTAGLWTDTFNGRANNNDLVHGVAADSAGNVIAVGETFDVDDGDDVWLRKYAPDGAVQWTETFHGITADAGYAVAVDGSDQIFVAGSTFTLDDDLDVWVARYSPAGAPGWTQTFNGPASGADEALGIAVDPAGNVVVAGYTTTAGAGRDIWVRKYSPAGAPQWSRTAAGSGSNNDEGHAVATDGDGNVLVTGFVWAGADGRDIWVRKYDAAGAEQWTRTHAGPAGDNDEGNGVAADAAGNVIVAGYQTVQDAGRDVWVRKYDAAGTEQWTQTFNAPQDGSDTGRGVAVDGDGAIVVAASVFRGTQSDNIWVRKYDTDGNEQWTSTYNSDGFGSDVASAVAVDADGNIAVGGFETRTDLGQFRNAWVRRMLQ
ncbi:MAG: DUF4215 domain-containing protein [Nannocystaceae bacterium]